MLRNNMRLIKNILMALMVILVIVLSITYLKRNDSNLKIQNVNFGSNLSYFLNKPNLVELLDKGEVTQNELKYFVQRTDRPEKNIIFYNVKVEPEKPVDADYRFGEGLIVQAIDSNTVLQAYLEQIWADKDIISSFEVFPNLVSFLDINKDGLKEFVIHGYYGGNSISSEVKKIFQLNNGKFNELNLDGVSYESRYVLSSILDIDDDGLYEAVVIDTDWEISSCTDHSSGPLRYMIYSWNGEKYVENSKEFPQYYDQNINRDIDKECSNKKEFCFGPALGKYFAYKQAGKEKEGWNKFLESTKGVENLMWPSKSCLNYVINLHNTDQEIISPEQTTSELMNSL